MTDRLASARRVVIKIGSSLLIDSQTSDVRRAWLDTVADDVTRMRGRGQEVLIVSSGAIALGRHALKLPAGELKLEQAQAAAAAGQTRLTHAYENAFARHKTAVAQVLLTLGDTEERRRYLNARTTIQTILKYRAMPVINENDTVATSEIRYGDNDRLGARVAQMTSADCLVLLSDVDGLYTSDPLKNKSAKHLSEIDRISPEIEAMAEAPAEKTSRQLGSGGMKTKIAAAKIAIGAGCNMVIAKGAIDHPLTAIENGAPCTWFQAAATPIASRKQWIDGALKPQGVLTVDNGAEQALLKGKSLLPAGITSVVGTFDRGDAVLVKALDGREIAKGLIAYASRHAEAIAGHKSREIENVLGYRGRDEMIHRDDLVLSANLRAVPTDRT